MPAPLVEMSALSLDTVKWDRAAIEKVLPHRPPLALLDGVYEVDQEREISAGFMQVTNEMFWVPGHFPGNPLLPGIVLVEAAAQLSVFSYKIFKPEYADKLMVFGGVDHVRFRGVVKPGDKVNIFMKNMSASNRFSKSETQAWVGDRCVYEGEIFGINT